MEPMTIAAVASLASSVFSLGSSRLAKRAARRQAREEARIERQVTGERVRQLYSQERTMAGETVARSAGSGVVTTIGSPLMVLSEQATEFERERRFVQMVGASRANAAIAQGRALGRQYQAQGLQNLFAGVASAAQYWHSR